MLTLVGSPIGVAELYQLGVLGRKGMVAQPAQPATDAEIKEAEAYFGPETGPPEWAPAWGAAQRAVAAATEAGVPPEQIVAKAAEVGIPRELIERVMRGEGPPPGMAPGPEGAPGAPGIFMAAGEGFDWLKWGLIGGGVLAVGIIAYLLLRPGKPARARARR